MQGSLYSGIALIDSSAAIALQDPEDALHQAAIAYFESARTTLVWAVVNVTSHETFTRARYRRNLTTALDCYDFLRADEIRCLTFTAADEQSARTLVERYSDQTLSFHDALCAAVMLRHGVGTVFTFDRDFWTLGFSVVPGLTR